MGIASGLQDHGQKPIEFHLIAFLMNYKIVFKCKKINNLMSCRQKATFDILSAFIQLQKGLIGPNVWQRVSTDGARTMAGQHTGPITRVKAVPSPVTSVHVVERGWLQRTCLPI